MAVIQIGTIEASSFDVLVEMGWKRIAPRGISDITAQENAESVVLFLFEGCGHCTTLVDSLPSEMLQLHVELS